MIKNSTDFDSFMMSKKSINRFFSNIINSIFKQNNNKSNKLYNTNNTRNTFSYKNEETYSDQDPYLNPNDNQNTMDIYVKIPINCDVILQNINLLIEPHILKRISKLQEVSHKASNLSKNNECCICLEDDQTFVTIDCGHPICHNCFISLTNKLGYKCPLCNKTMQIIDANKLYAVLIIGKNFEATYDKKDDDSNDNCNNIVSNGNNNDICKLKINNFMAIVYFPPIYSEENDIWLSYDLYNNLQLKNEQSKLLNTIDRLIKEQYILVVNDLNYSTIKKIYPNIFKNIKILVMN